MIIIIIIIIIVNLIFFFLNSHLRPSKLTAYAKLIKVPNISSRVLWYILKHPSHIVKPEES